MISAFMPKIRAIGVPVNDYFVDLPDFRYNEIPLEKVSKDKDGFWLTLDDEEHSEYFISRQSVAAPNSGGNTSNVFLGLVALYSAMEIDVRFKIIPPDDRSSIAQQEIDNHIYIDVNIVQVHTNIWGSRECYNGNAQVPGQSGGCADHRSPVLPLPDRSHERRPEQARGQMYRPGRERRDPVGQPDERRGLSARGYLLASCHGEESPLAGLLLPAFQSHPILTGPL